MKKNLVYLVLAIAVFAGCSPTYKTSQTPDDVYYSPAKKMYVADTYESDQPSSDDQYLRMKAKDYDKWSTIDDYDYWYDSRYYYNNMYTPTPYSSSVSVSMGIGFGSYPYYNTYSPYWYNSWSSWYSPCYTVVYYKNPAVYYKPVSKYSLSTYSNHSYNNYNMPLQTGSRASAYTNSNSTNRNNDSYYNHTQNNNSYTPSRSFSGGSSSSMGGGARISGGGGRARP
jgi:hypothetical protein